VTAIPVVGGLVAEPILLGVGLVVVVVDAAVLSNPVKLPGFSFSYLFNQAII